MKESKYFGENLDLYPENNALPPAIFGERSENILNKADRHQVIEMLKNDSKLSAVKLVVAKTNLRFLEAKNFIESFQNGNVESKFRNHNTQNGIRINMVNIDGAIRLKFQENGNSEKNIYPNDPEWIKVKMQLGEKPELIEYENNSIQNHPSSPKSKLFVENILFEKWKYFVIILVLLTATYYLYQNY